MVLAALSLGAAVIHLVAAPSHYVELGDLGAGFLIAAVFQAGWAKWWLGSSSNRVGWLGIAGNAAIILAWAWSRTMGLPVGPEAGLPESVGLADGVSTIFEFLIIVGLAARLWGLETKLLGRIAPARRTLPVVFLVPALGLVLFTTSFATLDIAAGHEHGHRVESSITDEAPSHTLGGHSP